MAENEIKGWINFNQDSGLSVSPQAEIFNDLTTLFKSSFGEDFVIQEGSEMYTFLNSLAEALAKSGGEYKKIYDSIGFISASGVTLDNAVSLAGIKRDRLVRSSVKITITRDETVTTDLLIQNLRISDINGNSWEPANNTFTIYTTDWSNNTYELEFFATDGNIEKPYNVSVKANNDGSNEPWSVVTGGRNGITFQNKEDSTIGREKETDGQLKYRYYTALHNASISTIDGLKSKLLNAVNLDLKQIDAKTLNSPIKYVYIYQNTDSAKDNYEVAGHSIWVIIAQENDNKEDNETIAKIIANYKSLGVGTSFGKSTENYRVKETIDGNDIYFSRVENKDCYVNVTLNFNTDLTDDDKNKIKNNVKTKINNYIDNLGIGEDVLFQGVASAIFTIYEESGFKDYTFDITSITIGEAATPSGTKMSVDIYQNAVTDLNKITVNG